MGNQMQSNFETSPKPFNMNTNTKIKILAMRNNSNNLSPIQNPLGSVALAIIIFNTKPKVTF